MNPRQHPDRVIEAWLQTAAPPRATGALLERSLARVAEAPQTRPFAWRPLALQRVPSRWAIALIALTMLTAALLGAAVASRVLVPPVTETPVLSPVTQTPVVSPLPETRGGRGWIAFAADSMAGIDLATPVDYGRVETSPQDMDIYIVREGDEVRRIIGSEAHERCPAFSPDGTRLAYLESPFGTSSGEPTLVVVRLDEDGAQTAADLRIPLPPSDFYGPRLNVGPPCPQWSPDGSRLAYLSYSESDQAYGTTRLRASSAIDGKPILSTDVWVEIGGFAWSPDGDAIAYTTLGPTGNGVDFFNNWTLSRLQLDGGAEAPILRAPGGTALGSVSWSPNGEIALQLTKSVDLGGGTSRDDRSIAITAPDGSMPLRPVNDLVPFGSVAWWSPDGDTLAVANIDGVALLGSDASGRVDIEPSGGVGGGALWSPDGQRLAGFGHSESGIAIVAFPLSGTPVEVLTPYTWALDWVGIEDVSWQPTR